MAAENCGFGPQTRIEVLKVIGDIHINFRALLSGRWVVQVGSKKPYRYAPHPRVWAEFGFPKPVQCVHPCKCDRCLNPGTPYRPEAAE